MNDKYTLPEMHKKLKEIEGTILALEEFIRKIKINWGKSKLSQSKFFGLIPGRMVDDEEALNYTKKQFWLVKFPFPGEKELYTLQYFYYRIKEDYNFLEWVDEKGQQYTLNSNWKATIRYHNEVVTLLKVWEQEYMGENL